MSTLYALRLTILRNKYIYGNSILVVVELYKTLFGAFN